MTRPEKTYPLTLEDIEIIADALSELNAAQDFFISNVGDIPTLVKRGQQSIRTALGADAHLVYGQDDPETRPA